MSTNFKCKRCSVEKELCIYNFNRNKSNKTGFDGTCRECRLTEQRKNAEYKRKLQKERMGKFRDGRKRFWELGEAEGSKCRYFVRLGKDWNICFKFESKEKAVMFKHLIKESK